jgi:hypothetical protein
MYLRSVFLLVLKGYFLPQNTSKNANNCLNEKITLYCLNYNVSLQVVYVLNNIEN